MRTPLAKYLPALALSLLMLLQAGCNGGGSDNAGGDGGDDNPPPTTNAPAPAPTPIGTPDGAPVSASIGVAGGTITTPDGKAKLTIPPDALTGMTTITLQPISNNAHGGLGKAFRLTPEGQTFAKPVQLTFTYTDEDLVGTSAKALGIAFQQTDGLWQWVKYPVVNAVDRTVTVETTHFSDWSLVEGYLIRPSEATVQTGKTLALHVAFCYAPRPSEQDPVILGYQCDGEQSDTDFVFVDEWSVNGVPGGNGSTGTVTTTAGGGGDAATYTAPATKPNPATVSVSARVDPADLGTYPEVELVISNITITEPSGDYAGTVQFDNTFASGTAQVTWKKVAEQNGVTLYQAIGSMQITTHVDGCQNQELSFPLISDNNPSNVSYKLMVYPESHPEYPQQYAFDLVGEGPDIAMQCAGSTFTYPARMFTNVTVGMANQNVCSAPPPTYSDKSQLVGTWECPPALNSASWTFTAQ